MTNEDMNVQEEDATFTEEEVRQAEQDVMETVTDEDGQLDNKITINGEEYELRAMSPKQAAKLSNVLGECMIAGNKKLRDLKAGDNASLALGILASLDDKMIIRFAAALVGEDEQFVEENFDFAWVTEAFAKQLYLSNVRGIIQNFTLLLSQLA